MSILVTGGAGYIGSHVVSQLLDRGDEVVVVDDLSSGFAARIPSVDFVEIDLAESRSVAQLGALMRERGVESVVHFAAKKRVPESLERPVWYYRNNVGGLANLLAAMHESEVHRLVFSSSAAVYGATEGPAIRETDPTQPVNPYGETKLAGEWLVAAAAAAGKLRAVSLRYFNVAGATRPELGDRAVLNLVPMVFEKIQLGGSPLVFGDDYATPDGTCVRDFVHVHDLAAAHLATLDHLATTSTPHEALNVGTGIGTSVREMIEAILVCARRDLVPEVRPRRAGDPAFVVADPSRIAGRLGWSAKYGLEEIVASAWESHLHFRSLGGSPE